jgi:hypothetical protein
MPQQSHTLEIEPSVPRVLSQVRQNPPDVLGPFPKLFEGTRSRVGDHDSSKALAGQIFPQIHQTTPSLPDPMTQEHHRHRLGPPGIKHVHLEQPLRLIRGAKHPMLGLPGLAGKRGSRSLGRQERKRRQGLGGLVLLGLGIEEQTHDRQGIYRHCLCGKRLEQTQDGQGLWLLP